jgi:hypothetical protein
MKVSISNLKPNLTNPRIIKKNKFKKLVQSIKDFPEMLELRPIVVDEDMVILGGNMRYKACVEAGLKEVPIKIAKGLTEEQKQEFIIKDNVGFGEWDWDIIANTWNHTDLENWAMDLPVYTSDKYTQNIKPEIYQLFDEEKTKELIEEIKKSNIKQEEKEFLIKAANRHTVFNYENIAEFYVHSNKEVQELMEKSALVLIDLKKAIENGFVELTKYLIDIRDNEG